MATHNVCSFNKYGYCKYREICRNHHINELCVDFSCDDSNCALRHPIPCKYFRKYKKCKFNPCAFKHVDDKSDIEKLKNENQSLLGKIEKIDADLKLLYNKEIESNAVIEKLNEMEKTMKHKDEKIDALHREMENVYSIISDQEKKIDSLVSEMNLLRTKTIEDEIEKDPQ